MNTANTAPEPRNSWDQTFPEWLSAVDDAVFTGSGLRISDLPDADYRSLFEADCGPEDGVVAALEAADMPESMIATVLDLAHMEDPR